MKISELLERLGELQGKHGDLEVFACISSPNGGAYGEIKAVDAEDKNAFHSTELHILLTGAE